MNQPVYDMWNSFVNKRDFLNTFGFIFWKGEKKKKSIVQVEENSFVFFLRGGI